MKRLISFAIVLSLLFCFSGCDNVDHGGEAPVASEQNGEMDEEVQDIASDASPSLDTPSPDVNPFQTAKPIQTAEPSQTDAPLRKATIAVDYADDQLLARPEAFDEFIDYPSQYQVNLVFTTDVEVTEFKFLSLSFVDVDENGGMKFDVEELYTAAQLTPERPLVIRMTFVGDIPDRGISYRDTDGNIKYYALGMSGENGSLLLEEFTK